MEKILGHHSISDWDFRYGATYRSLSTDYFVSPPTSLKIYKPSPGAVIETLYCRVASTLLLPEGELRTWARTGYTTNRIFMFRSQAPLGSGSDLNCYAVRLASTSWRLSRVIAGGWVTVGEQPAVHSGTVMEHWRIVWWNGIDGGGNPALAVDCYKESVGVWVQQGLTIYDPWNQWKNSAINRCGLSCQTVLNIPVYFDDTEIWGP